MKNLTLLLAFVFLCSPAAWASYQISGTVSADKGQKTEGINVVLIEQNPNKPPQGPIAMGKVGVAGVYQLEIDEVDPESNYVVGTRLGQVRASSKPFKIDQPKVKVDVLIHAAQGSAVDPASVIKGPFVFAGTVASDDGFDVVDTSVQVIEVTMKNPNGSVVARSKADSAGQFSITLDNAAKHSLYVVAVAKGAHMGSSDSFPLKEGFRLPPFKLKFLPVSQDPSQLVVKRNLYYFELMADKIQVSEILLVENQFAGTLDLSMKPFAKLLPQGAENFQLMRADSQTSVEEIGGKAMIAASLNPGRSQIFFSYDLPKSVGGGDIAVELLPNTEEVELVRTSAGFDVTFLGAMADNVVISKKGHGQEQFFSKRTLVEGNQKDARFHISVDLIPQKRLFYPATLLLVLLLSGLFWYVKVKPERK